MKLKWFVYYDHLDSTPTIVASGISEADALLWLHNYRYGKRDACEPMTPFRLYDDDGILYYSGWTNLGNESEGDCFAPLDWGMGEAGCTEMKILDPKTDEWATL